MAVERLGVVLGPSWSGGRLAHEGSTHVPDPPSPLPVQEPGDLGELGGGSLCPEDGGAGLCKERCLLFTEAHA